MAKVPVKTVVIIGAGLAGLGAAHTLTHSKKTQFNVVLLEAKPQAGGRAYTVLSSDGKYGLDMGAFSLYYYKKASSLTDIVERKKLAWKRIKDYDTYPGPRISILSNGEEISESSTEYYEDIFDDLKDELSDCGEKNDWKITAHKKWKKSDPRCLNPDSSMAEYIHIRFSEVLPIVPPKPLPKGCTPKHILNNFLVQEAFMDGVSDTSLMDNSAYGDYDDPNGQFMERASFADIVSSIVQELPPNSLQCTTPVSSVQWGTTQPSLVHCENGQTIAADHIIITPSVGVLKHWTANNFFQPQLSMEKTQAISKLGMGEGCVMFFEFSEPLLDREHSTLELFWLDEDQGYPASYPWAWELDLLVKVKDSNIYGVWLTGEKAMQAGLASEADVIEGVSLVLEKFLKRPIARPTKVHRQLWTADPYTRGIYSYCARGSNGGDRLSLAQPEDGPTGLQLLFAGEATQVNIFATANGAFESGVREAKRLLKHYS